MIKDPEQDLLACMMLESAQSMERIEELGLKPGHFQEHKHALIFKAMMSLDADGRRINLVSLTEHLTESGDLSAAGGISYLGGLQEAPLAFHDVGAYAASIVNRSGVANMLDLARRLASASGAPGAKLAQLVEMAESGLSDVARGAGDGGGGAVRLSDRLPEAYRAIEAVNDNDGAPMGIPTGFARLDKRTGGLRPGQMMCICGRPGHGKSSFAMNVAVSAAAAGYPVGVFSLEMGVDELARRVLYSEARVEQWKAQDGVMKLSDWAQLRDGAGCLSKYPVYIDDTAATTPASLRSKARRLQAKHGIQLLIVDYLQLMGSGGRNRREEVDEISRSLKLLAKELRISVIALSQLNRKCEERDDKRPILSDIRESGAIEQDSDLVLALFRPVVYNDQVLEPSKAWGILLKQRDGATGEFPLRFNKSFTRFEDWED